MHLIFLSLVTFICFSNEEEIALILPQKFGKYRFDKQYNPYKDIRKNIFSHAYDPEIIVANYHAYYTSIWSNCEEINVHDAICVECQPQQNSRRKLYCKGQNTLWRTGHFSLISPNCYGRWRKVTSDIKNECGMSRSIKNYILV